MKIPLVSLGLDCEKKELKDCPFCGNFKELYPTHDWDGFEGSNKWKIFCVNCHYGTMWFDSKEELIELWNTRTAENEKSFLVIDEEKLAKIFYENYMEQCLSMSHLSSVKFDSWESLQQDDKMRGAFLLSANKLSQNAKSFMRIEKCD